MKEIKDRIDILKNEFDLLANEYIKVFCDKQDIQFDFWVGDEVGGVASMGDYFFGYSDIRFDVDNDIEQGKIFDWYEHTLENHYKDNEVPSINYKNYLLSNQN